MVGRNNCTWIWGDCSRERVCVSDYFNVRIVVVIVVGAVAALWVSTP